MVLSISKSILYGSLESPSGKQREGFKSGYRIRVDYRQRHPDLTNGFEIGFRYSLSH